jgi:hypothetical protein
MKRSFILATIILFSAVSLGHAAGVIALPKTGQTRCYDTAGSEIACAGTGQDGDIQAGAAWPDPRFTVSGDCVTDNLTGLVWPKNGNLAGQMDWNDAIDYANNLTLCDYSDWRLPNVNELQSLVNAGEPDNSAWLMSKGFTNVQSDVYWSSTTYADYTDYAWVVYMWYGRVDVDGKSNGYYVWPVRAGQ